MVLSPRVWGGNEQWLLMCTEDNVDWKTLSTAHKQWAIAHRSIFTMSWMSYYLHHFLLLLLHYMEPITLQIHNCILCVHMHQQQCWHITKPPTDYCRKVNMARQHFIQYPVLGNHRQIKVLKWNEAIWITNALPILYQNCLKFLKYSRP